MKIPLPKNKLITLTLLGAFVAAAASLALAFPAKVDPAAALPADAPREDPNFQPAVQEVRSGGGEHGERGEWEEHGERGEHADGESHDERGHDDA